MAKRRRRRRRKEGYAKWEGRERPKTRTDVEAGGRRQCGFYHSSLQREYIPYFRSARREADGERKGRMRARETKGERERDLRGTKRALVAREIRGRRRTD